MFCPKCGQSQSSDALRFCSRCGFPLAGVADLLARDGAPAHPALPPAPQPPSPRNRGIRQGGAITLVGVFLTPVIAMMHPLMLLPGEYALIGVIVFLAGLLRMLYAAMFQSAAPDAPHSQQFYAPPAVQGHFAQPVSAAQLPRGDFRPAQGQFPQRQDTAEIVRPPASVTDHTTRLLADEDDPAGR